MLKDDIVFEKTFGAQRQPGAVYSPGNWEKIIKGMLLAQWPGH